MSIYLVEVKNEAGLHEDTILNLGKHGYAIPVFVFSAASAEAAEAAACENENMPASVGVFKAKLLAETPHEGEARVLRACWDLSF